MTNGQPQKKLLLIRPKIPNDAFTTNFSHPASDLGDKARAEGWQVTELEGNATTPNNVKDRIQNEDPDFIIHYDHGGIDKLYGQENGVKKPILECSGADPNVNLLSSAVVSTVSCSSALILGPAAVAANERDKKAYLGYDMPFGCEYAYWQYFARAANKANIALLEGKTFQQAKTLGKNQYTSEINNLLTLPGYTKYVAVLLMLIDRAHLTLVGNGSAIAQKPQTGSTNNHTLWGRSIGPLGVPQALLYQLWKLREKYIRPEIHKKIHPII